MNKRIRYENTEKENILVSVRNFHSESTDAMYIVYLNLDDVTYEIKNMTSGRKYTGSDNVNSSHVLKRNVKERLGELGVKFGSDIRDNSNREAGVNCAHKRKKDDNQTK